MATSDQAGEARLFIRRYGLRYPDVLDDIGGIETVLGVAGLPATVFDRDGKVVAPVIGGVSEQKLVSLLDDALRA